MIGYIIPLSCASQHARLLPTLGGMERTPLTPDALAAALPGLPGWELRDGRLHREIEFADFRAAFAFMTRVAFDAEELDHHPDWSNVWNRVTIDLETHDAGGITGLDLELARRISASAG
jgi:4a-hydroxytetrahydrobiopterin dehydratase